MNDNNKMNKTQFMIGTVVLTITGYILWTQISYAKAKNKDSENKDDENKDSENTTWTQ